MATPFECYTPLGYNPSFDLEVDHVHAQVLAQIDAGTYSYIHFGIVCTSWGPAGRLSGGNRRIDCVLESPDSKREVRGNQQAKHMQEMILALLSVG